MAVALEVVRDVSLMTDTSVTHYGVDLVLDGRIEYPGTLPMSVESEERTGCVTA
jgi:hypothetical protein